jgi:Flp pilus assembly pilin Flp
VVQNPPVNRAGSQGGATAVAYALMVAVIGVLLAAGVWMLSDQLGSTLSGGAECVARPGSCEGGGSGGSGPGGGGSGGGGGTTTSSTGPAPTTTTTVP